MDSDTGAPKRSFRLVPLREEGLERKLALAFGFMSFIPVLLLTLVMLDYMSLSLAVILIIPSALLGYFFVVAPTIRSVMVVTQHAKAVTSGQAPGQLNVSEQNEIGELAKAFNRITQELEEKIDELESSRQLVKKLLARIGTAIVSYEGIDNILNLIVENMAGALEAQMGSLMLLDGEKQDLYLKTGWSRGGEAPDRDRRVKLGEGIGGWVVKEGRPMRSAGTAEALGFSVNGHPVEGHVLCVPLKLRDHPMGMLAVLRDADGQAFTDDDESLMASIGSQVAVAIENYRLNLDVERTYVETIMALAMAVEAKDPYSAGHSKRVGYYAAQLGAEMGLDEEMQRVLNDAGVLHDIGKIGIKDEILLKQGHLSPDEEKIMQQHPIIGEAIVKPVRSLGKAVTLVRHHHEHYDGSGYPGGLKGEAIPLGARVLAVADTYDAMITDRPYRKRLSQETAVAELRSLAGVQFDPQAVEAFCRVLQRKDAHRGASAPVDQTPTA